MLSILFDCVSFSFFLITDFLIPVVVAKMFNSTAELAMPIGTPTKNAKTKIETHLVISKNILSNGIMVAR